jgi:hypothetical protein
VRGIELHLVIFWGEKRKLNDPELYHYGKKEKERQYTWLNRICSNLPPVFYFE